jgi:hypothetical protein
LAILAPSQLHWSYALILVTAWQGLDQAASLWLA